MFLPQSLSAGFLVLGFAGTAAAQPVDRAQIDGQIMALRAEITKLEPLLLAPAPEDLKAYAEFLEEPDTGLVRLLPREKYDHKLSITGGGAYYSFRLLTHEYGHGSDLELSSGDLSVGFAGADFGFLAAIGDVPLEEVDLDHPAVRFLAAYQAPRRDATARSTHRELWTGIRHNGTTYTSRVPAAADTSYVLRSIDYGGGDVLVAFRVLRIDPDGSIVLVWHTLKQFGVPRLIREQP